MSEKEGASSGVVKFTTVVTLDGLNGGAEVSSDIRKKIRKGRKNVQLKT